MAQPLAAPRRRWEVWHLLLTVLLAVLIAGLLWWLPLSSSFYGDYVCIHCGTRRTIDRRAFAGVTYSERATLAQTPISRVLIPGLRQPCEHTWYELHFGASYGSLFRAREMADGWSDFVLVRMLVDDDDFARELALTPHPQEVWETICRAGRASPKQSDELVSEGYFGVYEGQSLAHWWMANEEDLRRLTAPPPPPQASSALPPPRTQTPPAPPRAARVPSAPARSEARRRVPR